jgi:uncharacterized membrane protein
MAVDVLRVLAVLCSGVVAGVFAAVTLSVMPALALLPPPSYIRVHRLLGAGYHPTMPIVVLAVLLDDFALALVTTRGSILTLLSVTMLLQVGVQLVSHLGNERLNKRVRAVDEEMIGVGWDDPRQAWRRWHLVRTVLALAVFALNTVIAVIPR